MVPMIYQLLQLSSSAPTPLQLNSEATPSVCKLTFSHQHQEIPLHQRSHSSNQLLLMPSSLLKHSCRQRRRGSSGAEEGKQLLDRGDVVE